MKIKFVIAAAVLTALVCSCGAIRGTSASESETTTVDLDSLNAAARVDPLIIEVTKFENREIIGDRSYIALVNGMISANIPTAVGMVASGVNNTHNALVFDKCDAHISTPHYDKKGTRYTFDVTARGASFFGRSSSASWRFLITVYNSGYATVSIESDDIMRHSKVSSWRFDGEVNKDRTDAAKTIMENYKL